jgi:hypothetical protein
MAPLTGPTWPILTTSSVDTTSFLPQAAKTTAATATDTKVKEREPVNFIETPKINLLQSSKT